GGVSAPRRAGATPLPDTPPPPGRGGLAAGAALPGHAGGGGGAGDGQPRPGRGRRRPAQARRAELPRHGRSGTGAVRAPARAGVAGGRPRPRRARPGAWAGPHPAAPPTRGRTVRTGQTARRRTASATLPRRVRLSPVRPWLPITIRSQPDPRATLRISAAGWPCLRR